MLLHFVCPIVNNNLWPVLISCYLCSMCVCQMPPSRPTPPLQRTSKTLAWTRLPISPSGRPLIRWVGQLGPLFRRVKNRHKHLDDLWTLSSLFSGTPPLVGVLTHRKTLRAPGPSRCHVPLVSPQISTPHPCVSLPSLSPSLQMRWSHRCGTANTSLLRTPSSLRLRGLSPRRL